MLEIHPKKMIGSHVPRCVQKNVPCAETETEKEREAEGRGGEKKAAKSSSFRGAVDHIMFHSLAGL